MMVFWIGAALAAVWVLQGRAYRKFWDRGLHARLFFSRPEIREGEEGELCEVIENRKILPLPVLHVNVQVDRSFVFQVAERTAVSDQTYRRDIFAILPWQRITRTLVFTGTKRGYYRCRQVELVGRDLFFNGPYVRKEEQDASLYVFPAAVPMDEIQAACQEMLGDYWSRRSLFEDPFSFRGIRDYQAGDAMRQVNWKASVRSGGLKVNVRENTAMARARILLNLKEDTIWTEEILLESVIRIGASAALLWLDQGIPAQICTNGPDVVDGEPVMVEAGAGPEHGRTILQALSRIDLKAAEGKRNTRDTALWEGLETEPFSHTMVLYVSCSSHREDLEHLEALRQKGASVLWIWPYTARQEAGRQDDREMANGNAFRTAAGADTGGYRGQIRRWRVEG